MKLTGADVCGWPRLCCLLLVLLTWSTSVAQEPAPAGRTVNTSLLIDLRTGPPPTTISTSGLYSDMDKRQIAPGIIPYSVNAQLWSDGSFKTRFIALPGSEQIEFSQDGDWIFPENTVLVKNFYLEATLADTASRYLVETRFFIHGGPVMGWRGFSYQWDDDGVDAHLLTTGATKIYRIARAGTDSVQELSYQFPASEDCQRCHTFGSGQVLGVRTAQLNRVEADGKSGSSLQQLIRLQQAGVFTGGIGEPESMPRWSDPADQSLPLVARARAYLASNCSHCHRTGGLRRTEIDLRHDTPLLDMGIVDQVSSLDDLIGEERRILKPADPSNSVLLLRMLRLDEQRMPPLATGVIDSLGADLLAQWIHQMGTREPDPGTSVSETTGTQPSLPPGTSLGSAYPNPFNGSTTIGYSMASPGEVSIIIFDVLGRPLRTLVNGYQPAGSFHVAWDGRDGRGQQVASGVYHYRLVAAEYRQTRRLSYLR
jgi:uncharacterized repeat protein (TIGR03806 family)